MGMYDDFHNVLFLNLLNVITLERKAEIRNQYTILDPEHKVESFLESQPQNAELGRLYWLP